MRVLPAVYMLRGRATGNREVTVSATGTSCSGGDGLNRESSRSLSEVGSSVGGEGSGR